MTESINDFPPYLFLMQVARHCPKAVATYMQIWKNKDKENMVTIKKNEIRTEYLTSLHRFRHDLLLLTQESLINLDENPDEIYIELVDWDDLDLDDEDFHTC